MWQAKMTLIFSFAPRNFQDARLKNCSVIRKKAEKFAQNKITLRHYLSHSNSNVQIQWMSLHQLSVDKLGN